MSQNRPLPPCEEVCLVRRRASTQKGGTLIAEDVTDRATHERRICDPDGYRPPFCPGCHGTRLYVHDYRERILRAEPDKPVVTTVRHECVDCDAIWQVLPAFVARYLWRTWEVIAHVLTGEAAPTATRTLEWPKVPTRTARRWRARWGRPATYLVHVLTASGEAAWAALGCLTRPDGTCGDLVAAYARSAACAGGCAMGAFAALIYRLQPRFRLV